MFRTILTAAIASAAVAAAPALAQPGGGHGGPPGGHPGGGPPMTPPGHDMTMPGGPSDAAMEARMNSQGPEHASTTGIANANENSVLSGTTAVSGPLTGLTTGMAVNFNGNPVGTVSRIVTSDDGTIRRVIVTNTNGRTVSLSPRSLTLENGVLTTTTFRGD